MGDLRRKDRGWFLSKSEVWIEKKREESSTILKIKEEDMYNSKS